MGEKSAISVRNLSMIYGDKPQIALKHLKQGRTRAEIQESTGDLVAVSDVSFDVVRGEIFVVMGLSGSGKSTLVRCLNRLVVPTAGSILIDDEDILRANEERLRQIRLNKVTMVFQHFALFPHKSVAENVEFGLKIKGVGKEERRKQALDLLSQVGLEKWAQKYPSNLSGGMQQRVGLARSLAVNPDILLMDEAFSALDPLIRTEMQQELLRLHRKMQKTIIFITHDLHEALTLGSRIAIMKDGRFVQVGTPQEIVSHPADDYVAAFTRDVDRGRVFLAKDVMAAPEALIESKDTSDCARHRLSALSRDQVYVVDDAGRPVGLVSKGSLAAAGSGALGQAIRRSFQTVPAVAALVDVYGKCTENVPIAVVADDGTLIGVVNPLDVFAMLSGKPDKF
jgi:glycine betaine/proline transport system ATP-binding protein